MPSVFRLAFVDFATPSVEEALSYYSDTLGLNLVARDGSTAYLSLGLDHHNLSLREAARPALSAIGLQCGPDQDLDDLADRLSTLGLRPSLKRDARPGVPRLLEIAGIGGHTFQIVDSMDTPGPGFGRGGVGPVRLGHVAIASGDAPRIVAFLRDGLGFSTTDWFDELATFLTCNRDHHVINVISAPVSTLHHLAFELDGRDHQFRAADLLASRGIPTLWGPARHTAGHNAASYHHGADQALIELYNDMDIFLPELGYVEPRPWHGDLPQRPKRWSLTAMSRWDTRYEFDLAAISFGHEDRP